MVNLSREKKMFLRKLKTGYETADKMLIVLLH
jgi:hypothetical protein